MQISSTNASAAPEHIIEVGIVQASQPGPSGSGVVHPVLVSALSGGYDEYVAALACANVAARPGQA